jgi:hypothetical protein
MTGNCFRMTSGEEQAEGLPTFLPVPVCSTEDGQFCLRQGKGAVRPDFAGSTRYIPVPRCTKYETLSIRMRLTATKTAFLITRMRILTTTENERVHRKHRHRT